MRLSVGSRKQLKLESDHLYFSVNKKQFNKICSYTNIYPLFRDVTTERPDMSYRGLYIAFQNAFYLEILLEDLITPVGSIGVALSDLAHNIIDTSQFETNEKVEIKQHELEGKDFFKSFRVNKGKHTQPYVFCMEYDQECLGRRIAIHYNYPHILKKINIFYPLSVNQFDSEIKKFDTSISLKSEFISYIESNRREVEVQFESESKSYRLSFNIS